MILAASLLLLCTLNVAKADVWSPTFVGAVYRSYDAFYGDTVVAYELGSSVALTVPVYNTFYNYNYWPINVSTVKIWFDWGVNYTSLDVDENHTVQIQPWQTSTFTISFTVPTDVTNLIKHTYTVYVEHIDRQEGTPKNIVGTWTYTGSNFAVYSADQADAQNLYTQLLTMGVATQLGYYSYYTLPPIANFPYLPIVSSEARMLWTNARNEATSGAMSYMLGDFATAKSHYQSAYDMTNQSLTIEAQKGSNLEDKIDSFMGTTGEAINKTADSISSFADALQKMGDSSAAQAQAFLILSIGVAVGMVLVGLGALLYGLAKRKISQSPPLSERQP